jgi:surface protein
MFHSSPFNSPLNWGVNTGNVTSMVGMFHSNGSFNQDISGWDVSSVTNMYQMFYRSGFNSDLNSWDVSSLTNAEYMFQENSVFNGTVSNWQFTTDTSKNISMANMFKSARAFNQNISGWDVTRVTNMSNMFNGASVFNTPLNWGIKTGNVTNMAGMFGNTVFNQDISGWDVSKVTNMSGMFYRAIAFNGTISNWDVSKVTNMSSMFVVASSFNQDLSNWDVSSVTNMSYMFHSSPFNSPLNWGVNTGNVTSMDGMFHSNGSFNQDISGWDVSSVTNMDSMFAYANAFNSPLNWGIKTGNVANMNNMFRQAPLFNQDINGWDVSKVTTTVLMFYQANSFNQDLNSWDVSSLTNPSRMFESCSSFNGNISSWQFTTDPAKSINMSSMFLSATSFNQNISAWNISRVTNLINFLNGGKLSRENYDALLLGWSTLDAGETQIPTGLNAHFGSSKYSNTAAVITARDTELISNKSWTITDGGVDSDFTLPLIASNSLALDNTTISITFSEAVYRTNVGSGTLEIADFLFAINGGTATPSSTTPISITSTNNLTFVLGIGLTGTPNGNEILTVTPVLNAVFDASGNVASTTQTNNTAQLHDLSVPVITGPNGAVGLTSILSFNENQTTVFGFTVDKAVSWSLGSSNDEALFALDASGTLIFNSAPDFETPLSSTSSNTYLVEVIVTDSSSNLSTQTLTITILDVAAAAFTTFSPITKTFFDDAYLITSPVSSNTSSITFTSSNTAVATVSGTTVTITGIGTAIITAAQAADATYDDNTTTSTLTVNGVSVVDKYGRISTTSVDYVNKYGGIGGAVAYNQYGASLQAKTYDLVPGMALHLDAGDVSSYPGSGTAWTDLSGNGNHGTLNNGIGYTSADGGALVFDGGDDFFVTDSNLDLSDTDKITVQIILKSSLSDVRISLEHSANWNSNNAFGLVFGYTGGKMYVTDHNQGYNTSLTSSNMIDSNWHFFGTTLDRSLGTNNQNVVYVDGVLNDGGTISGQTTDNSGNYGNFPLFIGSRAGSSYFFNGKIAHVLIYKRVLTAAEMQQNFNALKARYGL